MLESLKETLIIRVGISEDEADSGIESFVGDLDGLLEDVQVNNRVEILLEAEALVKDHFGLEPDYLAEFLPI